MAVEAKRGCGYRKVGGIYLVSDGSGIGCCRMPIPLHVCPTCNQGIKQTRGWQWIDPLPWLKGDCVTLNQIERTLCPLVDPKRLGERVGLLWIGAKFYPTPGAFADEANMLGVSRRIKVVPRGFKVGVTWVFVAHPKVLHVDNAETGEMEWLPGIFRVIRPTRIEKIITQTMSENPDIMADLEDRGITPVIVPDNDKDHQGNVYDDDAELPFDQAGDQPEARP
jgi:hypothetical protein